MDVEGHPTSPTGHDEDDPEEAFQGFSGNGIVTVDAATRILQEQGRNRSPTPPRALFRSTTGKGVAFTEEDVTFLCKFLAYRK